MPAVLRAFWERFITAVAVWAAGVFVLMFYHEKIGIHSEAMPQIVFGSFAVVLGIAVVWSIAMQFIRR